MPLKISLIIASIFFCRILFSDELVNFQNCKIIAVDINESAKLIRNNDFFIDNMSPFDRSSRLKTSKEVDTEEYKNFIVKQVLNWENIEKNTIDKIILNLKDQIKPYDILFPKEIFLVKTTGAEEGNAAYCRSGNIIVLPVSFLKKDTSELHDIILHELFHIFSKNNLLNQERLYNIIGFYKSNELTIPGYILKWKITNPDAVQNNYYFKTQINKKEYFVMPILLANSPYNEKKGGDFFDYLSFNFIVVTIDNNVAKPLLKNNKAVFLQVSEISNYFEMVGENTEYIIHPEEILGDNFVLLINQKREIKSPEIVEKMKKVLQEN